MARERCGESGESAKERFSEEERTSNLCTDGRDSTIILSYQPSRTEEEDSEPCAECFSKRGGLIRRVKRSTHYRSSTQASSLTAANHEAVPERS